MRWLFCITHLSLESTGALTRLALCGLALCFVGLQAAPALASPTIPTIPAIPAIGVVTFAVGQVSRVPAGQPASKAMPLQKDQALAVGDRLVTGPSSHVHVRFIDGGLVSVRDSSELVITQYSFDPENPAASKVRFDLQGGVARSITGRAGQVAKDQFRLNTPVAALGVRGTDFAAFASREESLFTVNSGVVVVAALTGNCSRDALGPCAGPNSLELMLGGYHSARVGSGLEKPQPIPEVPNALRLASYTNGSSNGNGNGNTNSSTSGNGTANAAGKNGSDQASVNATGGASTGTNSNTNTSNEVTDRKGIQDIVASKVIDPSGSVLSNSGLPALAWGYWQNAGWAKAVHQPAQDAMEGRQVTVGNEQVGLFRDPVTVGEMPRRGSVRLRLDSSQVVWQGNTSLPAVVQSSSLDVNFAAQSFATTLVGSQPDIGVFSVQATGPINVRGSQPGVFISEASQSNARVAGALTQSGSQAGYFFEKPEAGSLLTGTTLWRQQ